MNEKRLAVVKHAWQSLNEASGDSISWGKLQTAYQVEQHPRVRTREKKSEQVRAEFVELMGKRQRQGVITEQGFIEYYADVNATLPAEKDEYFVETVLRTWGLQAQKATVTAPRTQELEAVVFEKIRQRTHGAEDEGRTIKKIFKHFDLNGYGTVDAREFRKGLETLGCTFSEQELEALFSKFDTNGNGKLDYEEFSKYIAHMGSGNNPNVNPVFGVEREPPNQVLDKIRLVLKARGPHGLKGLSEVLRRIDHSKDHRLDRAEFQWGLRENGHVLTPSEFERIFKYFDRHNEGRLNYEQFLERLRGNINERRRALVQLAFRNLDKAGAGAVSVEDLVAAFNAPSRSGTLGREQIQAEFNAHWE